MRGSRVVRVGSHTGANNLPNRLMEHMTKKKDRSIFRKNIGRALLNQAGDPFLKQWNWDLTKRKDRVRFGPLLDVARQEAVELKVSRHIEGNFTFAFVRIDDKTERLNFEKHAIATVAQCSHCGPSEPWLGNFSPVDPIRESGLWQPHCL